MKLDKMTKKEQIINFARHDPFLKISDIAENVGTTARYVRTILSEADISLMQLRKKHARNMEERLSNENTSLSNATVKIKEKNGEVESTEIKIKRINDIDFDKLIQIKDDEELHKLTQIRKIANNPYSLQEVITYLSSEIKDKVTELETLYDLIKERGIRNFKFKNNILEVREADIRIAEKLNLKKGDPVVKSERIILLDKIPIAIDNFYFDAQKIELVFPGELVV